MEMMKSKAGWVALIVASLVLVAGIWGPGLWDPWEMNHAFLGRRMADVPRVLVVEAGRGKEPGALTGLLRPILLDVADVVSTSETGAAGSPIQGGRALMMDHVFPVTVIDLDADIKDADDESGLRKVGSALESILPANRSTRILLISGGGGLDVQKVRDQLIEKAAGEEDDETRVTAAAMELRTRPIASRDELAAAVRDGLYGDAYTAHFKSDGKTVFTPPLAPYLVSLSLRGLGQSEFSARFPGVLLAILVLFLVFGFVNRVFGPVEAAVAVVVLATCPLFFGSARFVANEMSTVLGLTIGAMALAFLVRGDGSLKALPAMLGATLLLYLSGGMAAVVTYAAMVGVYPIAARDVRKPVLIAAAAVLGAAGAFAILTFVPDSAFFRQFRFTASTFAGGMRADSRSFDFVLKEVGFGMFPWSALLPLSVLAVVGSGKQLKPERLVLVLWALAPLVVLMITIRPMHHYLYAGLPALAVITAIYMKEAVDEGVQARLLAFFGFGLFLAMMKDIVLSPAPLMTYLTTDPMFSRPGKGDLPFPPGLKLSLVGKFAAIVAGASLLVGGGKLVSFARTLPALFRRGRTFRIVLIVLVAAIVLDLVIFLALKWNTISGSAQPGTAVGAVLLRIFLTGPDILALYLLVLLALFVRHADWCREKLEKLLAPHRIDAIGRVFLALERPRGYFTVMGLGALIFSLTLLFSLVPELSYHLSQKHIIQTYEESSAQVPGDLFRHGVFASRGSSDSNFYTGQVQEMTGRSEVVRRLRDDSQRTFFIVPKNQWSEINSSFRKRSSGEHAVLLDDRSSRFVLAVSSLAPDEVDRNWIAEAALTEEEFKALPDVNPTMVNFDNKIELVGYSLDAPAVRRGGIATLKMYFKCSSRIPVSYRVFMHIDRVGSSSRIHGDHWILNLVKETEDQKTCVGCFATTHWLKGDIVVDTYEIKVPIGSPSGPHNLWMGFYTPGGGKRLPVKDFDKAKVRHDNNNRVSVGILTVE